VVRSPAVHIAPPHPYAAPGLISCKHIARIPVIHKKFT
jgi:hypothetical protein